jgi:hypothetical protein
MKKMGIVHWALVGLALYEAAAGIMELTGTTFAVGGTQLPTAGTAVASFYDPANTSQYMGGIDLAAAALLFVFPLHKQLRG